ncbi:glutamyl-tRNA amidotransferase [candidate division MSBL1 archaeon SCGC-AAA261D19]|uniref:Glutamyl-tRNA(Gln) amidotransferase subunit D n=1 Tax=candidate division MSBL1 archaeon SCGC-AAA261D19 TaxID=1698273 RepID=A0A133V8J7_9EURY|nr:glutamyl-tRNA amidotransferase [candidate division MSBL1 archaeon SCGC-AAA261D19]
MGGYRGKARELLESKSISVGDRVKIRKKGRTYEGLLMPRIELGDPNHLVVKLDSGYNVGVKVEEALEIAKMKGGKAPKMRMPPLKFERDPDKPNITIVGTGGTVASRVDYRTGAVHPAFSAQEIYNAVPELVDMANIKAVTACNVLSENMTPKLWAKVGETVADELNGEASGVVIAHGTDTMGYTAAALSFMLQDLSKPVVLVGSQRSSDRPSSDATLNLIGAVAAAGADMAGVCGVMHGSTEDKYCLIHRGTKMRKCHTSRRDAFQSVNVLPLGMIRNGKLELFQDVKRRSDAEVKVDSKFEEKVALIKTFPNIQSVVVEDLLDRGYRGIVLEGTGLGHVPESLYSGIKRAKKEGVPVVMTSQCIWGRVNMRVYSTGRDLLELDVISGGDMLPETAYVKLMWVLGHTQNFEEVRGLMRKNLAGELTSRTRPDTFMKSFLPEG